MSKSLLKILIICSAILPFTSYAQHEEGSGTMIQKMKDNGIFTTLEIGANIGTTGLGLELASPVTEWTKLRVGFDWMPPFKKQMNLDVINYSDGKYYDKFESINDMMYKMTGLSIDKEVRMESKASITTFRLLIDVYPFKSNRHWHITAGFFAGGNSIAKTTNVRSSMSSLLAINMYDNLHKETTSEDFINDPKQHPLFGIIELDKDMAMVFRDKMLETGTLGVQVGDHKDGTPCTIVPDENGVISMKAKVNRFRPYIGFGYGGAISRDGKWQASFDAGVQFWGGVPKVTAHDGTVINDLINLNKSTQSYIDLMKAIPVYPNIDFRISYRF